MGQSSTSDAEEGWNDCYPRREKRTHSTMNYHQLMDVYQLLEAQQSSRKDHFPLPFIDEILERLANHSFCYPDGYSGSQQIPIHPDDQSKTTFTCPYGTFSYRKMSFRQCNALASLQRCMVVIFSDLVEKIMEVFMDDFSVYNKTFEDCLANLDKVLKWCQMADLVLN
jgi:hypothetical protein